MNKYQLLHYSSFVPILVRCTTDSWGFVFCWISYMWFIWLTEYQREWNGFPCLTWVRFQRENEIAMTFVLFLSRYIPSLLLLPCIAMIMFGLRRLPNRLLMNPMIISSTSLFLLSSSILQSLCCVGMILTHFVKYNSLSPSDNEIYTYIFKRCIQLFVICTHDLSFINRFFVFMLCALWKTGIWVLLPKEDGEWDIDIDTDIPLDLSKKTVYKAHQF